MPTSDLLTLKKMGKCATMPVCKVQCCGPCNKVAAGLCSIQATKPWGCGVYPHNPMALEKGCSIYFMAGGTRIDGSNYLTFPEEVKRAWLDLVVE